MSPNPPAPDLPDPPGPVIPVPHPPEVPPPPPEDIQLLREIRDSLRRQET